MKIRSLHMLLAIITIVGGGILLANELGLYSTIREKSPRVTAEGVHIISDIRGSHTLEEIEKYYQLPASSIIEAFGLKVDTDPNSFKVKDLKEIFKPIEIEGEEYIIETDTVRVFASLYLKNPYTSEETFYLSESIVSYLIENNKLTDKEKEYWLGHTFKAEYLGDNNLIGSENLSPSESIENEVAEEAEEFEITGKATIQELLDQGITEERFKEITGFKVSENKTIILKDFISEKGLEFKEVKEKFSEILKNR